MRDFPLPFPLAWVLWNSKLWKHHVQFDLTDWLSRSSLSLQHTRRNTRSVSARGCFALSISLAVPLSEMASLSLFTVLVPFLLCLTPTLSTNSEGTFDPLVFFLVSWGFQISLFFSIWFLFSCWETTGKRIWKDKKTFENIDFFFHGQRREWVVSIKNCLFPLFSVVYGKRIFRASTFNFISLSIEWNPGF